MLPREVWAKLRGRGKGAKAVSGPPSPEEVLTALRNPATIEKLKGLPEVVSAAGRLGNYLIVKCPSSPEMEGRSLDDVHTVIRAGFAMGGTDAFNVDRPIAPTAIHPRHFGTFPRIVGRFVREDHLFSLEEAVRKCTRMPAQVMGITDRGLIEPGYWADLVIFDPATLVDTATGAEPYRRAEGIDRVLVNGKVAVEKGEVKPVYAGKVLRRK